MNIGPTLDGGLRIDAEDPGDWEVLRCIVLDARGRPVDLASRLGRLIGDEPEPGDWEEFVVPDLRVEFDGQLQLVKRAIEAAVAESGPETGGSVAISRDDAELWFGALNQARLALEEVYRFSATVGEEPDRSDTGRRSAYFRSQFYSAVQELLLQFVID